MANNRNS